MAACLPEAGFTLPHNEPCYGDSGGLLNCQNADGSWIGHGVLSVCSGQGCNVSQKHSIFTKVISHIDWINTVSDPSSFSL
ncbi:unnamed protein product [Coregonus sp. 'balchen']|nr:unnamed protein product [Coregonus sp. 'balchen']